MPTSAFDSMKPLKAASIFVLSMGPAPSAVCDASAAVTIATNVVAATILVPLVDPIICTNLALLELCASPPHTSPSPEKKNGYGHTRSGYGHTSSVDSASRCARCRALYQYPRDP